MSSIDVGVTIFLMRINLERQNLKAIGNVIGLS
jgi:hypothetical protein